MGPRAVLLSARTLHLHLPSLSQFSVLPSLPLSRAQNSPRKVTHCFYRFASTSSFFTPTSTSAIGQQRLPGGLQLKSSLDKCYVIDEVLSERPAAGRIWCVYRATHEGKQFILKDIIPGDFDYIISLQKHVENSPHVRTAVDSIPERHMFVFPYLEKGLLHVDTAALSSVAKKAIIRDALTGLADLHDERIIHTDIKPTNIMMDSFKQQNGDLEWCNVQITDLEDAVILPPKTKGLIDRLSGNHFWRSPEAWARGVQNTPSDIYSFAVVAIFAWTGSMVFFSDKANRASPEEQAKLILSHHLSFFTSDEEDFRSFIAYHGGEDSPFIERIKELCKTFNEEKPRLPFSRWQQVDPQFRDLVCKMTCLDPLRRITARKALQHPWFAAE
ncbi:kinase-like protein [Xylariaceae sp. AK1471]|nr:kinase-like protein [Xylariaceae sp. AK1471]